MIRTVGLALFYVIALCSVALAAPKAPAPSAAVAAIQEDTPVAKEDLQQLIAAGEDVLHAQERIDALNELKTAKQAQAHVAQKFSERYYHSPNDRLVQVDQEHFVVKHASAPPKPVEAPKKTAQATVKKAADGVSVSTTNQSGGVTAGQVNVSSR